MSGERGKHGVMVVRHESKVIKTGDNFQTVLRTSSDEQFGFRLETLAQLPASVANEQAQYRGAQS